MKVAALCASKNVSLFDAFFKIKKDDPKGENVYELIKAVAPASAAALEIERRCVMYIDSLNPNALNANIPVTDYGVVRSLTKFDFFTKNVKQALVISSLTINDVRSKFSSLFSILIEKMSSRINIVDFKLTAPVTDLETIQFNLLEYAVLKNNAGAAKKLVDTGAKFNSNNKTELFFLISRAYFSKVLLVDILKACDADNALINNRKENRTPLMMAAFNGNYGAVQALGDIPGALFTLQDEDGNTCLHLVSGTSGYNSRDDTTTAIIKYLIGKRPELVDIKNKAGMGPGNPKWVAEQSFRDLIKAKKSIFGEYPNTEKAARNALATRKGGRKTRCRYSHKPSTKRYKRPVLK
jgi:hypothetical protein